MSSYLCHDVHFYLHHVIPTLHEHPSKHQMERQRGIDLKYISRWLIKVRPIYIFSLSLSLAIFLFSSKRNSSNSFYSFPGKGRRKKLREQEFTNKFFVMWSSRSFERFDVFLPSDQRIRFPLFHSTQVILIKIIIIKNIESFFWHWHEMLTNKD